MVVTVCERARCCSSIVAPGAGPGPRGPYPHPMSSLGSGSQVRESRLMGGGQIRVIPQGQVQRVSPHLDARTPGLLPDPGAGSLATSGCGRRGRGKKGRGVDRAGEGGHSGTSPRGRRRAATVPVSRGLRALRGAGTGTGSLRVSGTSWSHSSKLRPQSGSAHLGPPDLDQLPPTWPDWQQQGLLRKPRPPGTWRLPDSDNQADGGGRLEL